MIPKFEELSHLLTSEEYTHLVTRQDKVEFINSLGEEKILNLVNILNEKWSALLSTESKDVMIEGLSSLFTSSLIPFGIIKSIINNDYIAHSDLEIPLNLQTRVYLEDKSYLGSIEYIFGPVKTPCYRIESNKPSISIDTRVCYDPKEYTVLNLDEIPTKKKIGFERENEDDLEDEDEIIMKSIPVMRESGTSDDESDEETPRDHGVGEKRKFEPAEEDLLNELFKTPKSIE